MEKAMYSAEQIAQWFVNRASMDVDMFYGDYLTNMKLQKLLYFAQGLSFAILDKPLFGDEIQAWEHGPVVPDIYKKYKVCSNSGISDVTPVEIDEETSLLLEFVFKKYGIYSAVELRNLSHQQNPYKNNYVDGVRNIKIPNCDIKKEFSKNTENLKAEFKKNKNELRDYAETCYVNSEKSVKKSIIESVGDEFVEVDWKNEL